MVSLGYQTSDADHTLFIRHHKDKITPLIVYVDNIVITRHDKEEMAHLKKQLSQKVGINDLGKVQYFLGIEVARSRNLYLQEKIYFAPLDRNKYDRLQTSGSNHKLQAGMAESVNKERYQRLVR